MASRQQQLHEKLRSVLGINVYFQPPSGINMEYPCVRYRLYDVDSKKANNKNYILTDAYELVLIEYEPDTLVYKDLLSAFSMISLDRCYVADNLYHTIFTLYY